MNRPHLSRNLFNKFPKVAAFDYISKPGAENWLKTGGVSKFMHSWMYEI